MSSYRLEKDYCTACTRLLEGTGSILDKNGNINMNMEPYEGALTICGFCGNIMQFGKSLKLIPISPQIWNSLRVNQPKAFGRILQIIGHIKNKSTYN